MHRRPRLSAQPAAWKRQGPAGNRRKQHVELEVGGGRHVGELASCEKTGDNRPAAGEAGSVNQLGTAKPPRIARAQHLEAAEMPSCDLELLAISDALSAALAELHFAPPVAFVYDPLTYARPLWAEYLQRFASGRDRTLLVGMNPGPWGMTQTGVPFGEVTAVRDFLGLAARYQPPARQHPKVPIHGVDCPRREVSGQRVWGWASGRFGTAEAFFRGFFVANYCPLTFLESGGRNVTPDKLAKAERDAVQQLCDEALRRSVAVLRPRRVVGVGTYAEARAREALSGLGVPVGRILHPSPASPLANRDWAGQAEAQLRALGVDLPGAG